VKDDASLFDVISFIVDETCSEIVGLKMHECTTKNMFLMTCDSDEIPIEDEMPEIAATESSVAKLQHLVNISERKSAVALVDTLKSPVKKHASKANWPALPPQFLSTNQPDTTILVDDTGIENFGLTHDMTGQKFSASDNTDTFQLATNTVKCQNIVLPDLSKTVIPTSNTYQSLFPVDDDEDIKDDESSDYGHQHMAQSFTSSDPLSNSKKKVVTSVHKNTAVTTYRFQTNGYEIIDEIIESLRDDPVSPDDLHWWMSQVRKDLNASKSSLAQSLRDTSRTVVAKAKRALTDAASTALVINMDKLNINSPVSALTDTETSQ